MLILSLVVALHTPITPTPADVTSTAVGHYLVAIKSLRAELASVGTWSWDDEGAGCAVIRDDDSIVAIAKNSAECSAIAIHSKVSLAALDALIVAAEMMDRSDPRALSFVRESARGLICPLYPRRWRTLESAEGLLAVR